MNLNEIISRAKNENGKADVAIRYFEGDHDIKNQKIKIWNDEGVLIENTYASNTKLPNAHFTKLVNQSTNFLFGEAVRFKTEEKVLDEALKIYITDETQRLFYDAVEEASKIGWSWIYAYRDESGLPAFQLADGRQVTEVLDDNGNQEKVIRYYKDGDDQKAEVWDTKGNKETYVKGKDGYTLIDTVRYVQYNDEGKVIAGFDRIPWFKLKNNKRETSDIKLIKTQMDLLDELDSLSANDALDFPAATMTLETTGDDNVNKVLYNARNAKGIKLNPDSNESFKIEQNNINVDAKQKMSEKMERYIYTAGGGFDASQIAHSNGNVTNVQIMAAQQDLLYKVKGKEIELRVLVKWVLEIILGDIERVGIGSFHTSQIEVVFTHALLDNEKEKAEVEESKERTKGLKLDNILKVEHILDSETILMLVADVLGIDADEVKGNLSIEGYESLVAEDLIAEDNEPAEVI